MLMKKNAGDAILVGGASSYLATLFITRMLLTRNIQIIALVSSLNEEEKCFRRIEEELHQQGLSLSRINRNQIIVLHYPCEPDLSVKQFLKKIRKYSVHKIIQFSDYKNCNNELMLQRINVETTRQLIELSKQLATDQFIYLSSAYCLDAHDVNGSSVISHAEKELTPYTQSKRLCERMLSESEIPYLIVRPSNVIGDSSTGRYNGTSYGVSSLWHILADDLLQTYHHNLHIVANDHKLNFVHQDCLVESLIHLINYDYQNEVVHISSDYETSPSIKDILTSWIETYMRPQNVFFYNSLSEVSIKDLHDDQKSFLYHANVYYDIAELDWQIENNSLKDKLVNRFAFKDVDISGVEKCQEYFMKNLLENTMYRTKYEKFFANCTHYWDIPKKDALHFENGLEFLR